MSGETASDRVVESDGKRYYALCGCGWHGPDRKVDSDAEGDLQDHYNETGCSDDPPMTYDMDGNLVPDNSRGLPDDLMPHERRKKHGNS